MIIRDIPGHGRPMILLVRTVALMAATVRSCFVAMERLECRQKCQHFSPALGKNVGIVHFFSLPSACVCSSFFLLLLLFFRLCVQKSGTPRLLSIYDCVYDYWLFGAPSSPFYGIFRRGADHFSETFLLCQVRSVMGLSKSWLQYWMIFSIWSAISQCLQLLLKVKVQYTISSKTNYHSRFTNCTLKSSLCAHN